MQIAVLNRDRCQPKKCSEECMKFCPMVRTGDETVIMGEDNKPVISEELCVGCGICIKKCPFGAIHIVGLPEELEGKETHRYGINAFALYGLPVLRPGRVAGILGPNGIGKTTVVNILSGELKPNLSREDPEWDEILDHYAGSELQEHLRKVRDQELKVAYKPQYVDRIPDTFQGKLSDLLESADETGSLQEIASHLELDTLLDRSIADLSGGELQRAAVAAVLLKDVDMYFFDEITPYLDIYQRINTTRLIRELAENKTVLVVEHDLAILDLVADFIHIAYGEPGVYGVVTYPKGVRVGINQYLAGYLHEENIRIRGEAIEFEVHAPRKRKEISLFASYGEFTKSYDEFQLTVDGGNIREGEVIGIVGPNGIGKSTFVQVLAGVTPPTSGEVDMNIKISFKPQYLRVEDSMSVLSLLSSISEEVGTSYYANEILKPLQLEHLLESDVSELSGGELQRVAIATCLSRDAELYILDEPSAHLDIDQRALATKTIRRHAKNKDASAMVVDHDIYMIDLLSDRLMVFAGEPMVHGNATGPFEMREGMNRFLSALEITFRRDESGRPRINKVGSKLDREQKKAGEYYYQKP